MWPKTNKKLIEKKKTTSEWQHLGWKRQIFLFSSPFRMDVHVSIFVLFLFSSAENRSLIKRHTVSIDTLWLSALLASPSDISNPVGLDKSGKNK